MPNASYHFPAGFLWGTATSSHQVEGGNTNNNWYAWERAGRTAHPAGLACDWWGGRWQEDLDRAAQGGQNAHRLSVEWSRIQPEPGRFDEQALERYRQILQGARERGLATLVSLHHFTDPLWLSDPDRGVSGWESPAVVPLFEQFVRRTVLALREYTNLWCTINEPNVYALEGYVRRNFPPGQSDLGQFLRVQANMVRAHAAAYRTIHELQREARVGFALNFRPQEPRLAWSPLDRLVSRLRFEVFNLAFPTALTTGVLRSPLGRVRIPEARGTQDYFGLNYYCVDTVAFDLRNPGQLCSRSFFPEGSDVADAGMNANMPDGFFRAFQWAVRTFPGLPIVVTENGIEDVSDRMRPRFLAEHVHAMWKAVNFNWPIKGYFHWSLTDNFEWERGWTQPFGLWALDPETQVRTERPSAGLYAAICRENGLTSAMVEKYCPEAYARLFPR